jgi:hypothetical protein
MSFFATATRVLAALPVLAGAAALSARNLPEIPPARVAEIEAWLEAKPSGFVPAFADRPFWEAQAKLPATDALLTEANRRADEPVPELTEELYGEFKRSGRRDTFEKPFAARTERLALFALAQGLTDDGRWLPLIETELAATLDEPSWAAPAHAADLPDWASARTRVDLAASARAWTLATADWLLGDRLKPETRARIRSETRSRVLAPCLERFRAGDQRDYWWMKGTNNWNAVCHAGVTGAALLLDEDRGERAEFAAAFEADTAYFINAYPDDGYCEEGLGYWVYGFGHYIMGAEAIRRATGGHVDLFSQPKVARIAAFSRRWAMTEGIYAAFGDVSLRQTCPAWLHDFVAGRFGAGAPVGVTGFMHRHSLGTQLYVTAFDLSLERKPAEESGTLRLRDWFPDGGALVVRQVSTDAGFSVAMQGGHNARPHNHNDIGSFVVVTHGVPVLSDLGADDYVRDTFGPRRYTSGVMNSFGHPVPVVAGQGQRTGREARGVTVRTEFTDERDVWELDLTSAYDVPKLERLTRTFVFTRAGGGSLEISDHVRFREPQSFGSALILPPKRDWEQTPESGLLVRTDRAALRVRYSTDAPTALVLTTAPIHGIVPDRPAKGTRIGIDFVEPVREATLRMLITPASSDL